MTFTEYPYNNLRKRFGALLSDHGFDLMNKCVHPGPRLPGPALQSLPTPAVPGSGPGTAAFSQVPDLLPRAEGQRRGRPQARVLPRDPPPHRPLHVPHVARQERAAKGEAGHQPSAARGRPGLQPAGKGRAAAGWGEGLLQGGASLAKAPWCHLLPREMTT